MRALGAAITMGSYMKLVTGLSLITTLLAGGNLTIATSPCGNEGRIVLAQNKDGANDSKAKSERKAPPGSKSAQQNDCCFPVRQPCCQSVDPVDKPKNDK